MAAHGSAVAPPISGEESRARESKERKRREQGRFVTLRGTS
jgi:hypothetical protein